MPDYQRTGDCNDCGDCCGANGKHPNSIGYEAISHWPQEDIDKSYRLWKFLGLAQNPVTGEFEPTTMFGHFNLQGNTYYWVWHEVRPGKGHLPCTDISAAHDGSEASVECPVLKADPGNGTRPCAVKGTLYAEVRESFCRPEEADGYIPENDIWTEQSKLHWEADHPNCSYVFVEV